MSLPKPQGPPVKLTEKVYAKVKDHPKVSFYFFMAKERNQSDIPRDSEFYLQSESQT